MPQLLTAPVLSSSGRVSIRPQPALFAQYSLGRIGDAQRQGVLGMRVHHRRDIGPSLEDRGVNEPLQVERTLPAPHPPAVTLEFADIFGVAAFRAARARDPKT